MSQFWLFVMDIYVFFFFRENPFSALQSKKYRSSTHIIWVAMRIFNVTLKKIRAFLDPNLIRCQEIRDRRATKQVQKRTGYSKYSYWWRS